MVEGALRDGWPAELEVGVAGLAIQGEVNSGDLAVFAPYDRGGLAAVIDGLGHGDDAAAASAITERVILEHASDSPSELLQRCHQALRKSRGVVLTAAWFDLEGMELSWAGVGNVEARLVRGAATYGDRHDSALVLGGVVGYNLPQVRVGTLPLEPGDTVALATDGVGADFSASLESGVGAQELAERLLERHHKGTDDALAVVVRYLGPPAQP